MGLGIRSAGGGGSRSLTFSPIRAAEQRDRHRAVFLFGGLVIDTEEFAHLRSSFELENAVRNNRARSLTQGEAKGLGYESP